MGKGGGKRRETSMCKRDIDRLPLTCLSLDQATSQACVLIGNWTGDLLLCWMTFNQLAYAGTGWILSFEKYSKYKSFIRYIFCKYIVLPFQSVFWKVQALNFDEFQFVNCLSKLRNLCQTKILDFLFFLKFYNFTFFLRERGRKRNIDLLSNLCINWLPFVCGLTRDQTHHLEVWGQHSNQLSYQARAWHFVAF